MLSAVTSFVDRCGARLDRRRVAAFCAALLAVEITAFAFLVAGTYGLVVPLAQPTSTDFVSFYAAGKLANAGTPELVYDHAAHFAAEQSAAAPGIRYNYFYYPPVFVLLCAMLARLPYLAAFVLFEAGSFALFLVAMIGIFGERRWTTLLPVLAFPAVLWNVGLGQNALITAALFAAATLLIDRRPALAGALFGMLCYKPPFGLLIPVALAAAGRWRAFAAAAASCAALLLLSLAWFGPATWDAFLRAARDAAPVYENGVKLAGYVTPFGAVRVLGAPPALAYTVQGFTSLAAIAGVWRVWGRGMSQPVRAAALCAATLVATPFVMWYDLILASVAAAWLYVGGKLSRADTFVLAVLFVLLIDPPGFGKALHLPIGPFCTVLFVALVGRIAWRETGADHADAVAAFGTAAPAAPD